MGILRDFEKRLEGAVEGFFARAFRSGLQPVELAKAVQRYAAHYQQVGIDGVIVPNVYRFGLSPEDHERFSGFAGRLQAELADVLRRTTADRGWMLQGPVRIELTESDEVRMGTYELRGKIEAGPVEQPRPTAQPRAVVPIAGAGGEQVPGSETLVMPAAAATASLQVISGEPHRRVFPLRDAAVIGRLPDCDVTLDDPSVSRRHARLLRDGGRWLIEDLGSTNGVLVNGESVGRTELHDGDRLELGSVRLAFSWDG
jgi:pSer/pThr/pTyr-binding forkhead associated (FHA) protein